MKSLLSSMITVCLLAAPVWAATPLLTDDANTLGQEKGNLRYVAESDLTTM